MGINNTSNWEETTIQIPQEKGAFDFQMKNYILLSKNYLIILKLFNHLILLNANEFTLKIKSSFKVKR